VVFAPRVRRHYQSYMLEVLAVAGTAGVSGRLFAPGQTGATLVGRVVLAFQPHGSIAKTCTLGQADDRGGQTPFRKDVARSTHFGTPNQQRGESTDRGHDAGYSEAEGVKLGTHKAEAPTSASVDHGMFGH